MISDNEKNECGKIASGEAIGITEQTDPRVSSTDLHKSEQQLAGGKYACVDCVFK